MDNLTAQKVVAITIAQLRKEGVGGEIDGVRITLDAFEARLADNLKLAGIQRVPGPARKAKAPKQLRPDKPMPPHVGD